MKILLVGINSKFIHSNLALYYLKKATPPQHDTKIMEFSINQPLLDIIRDIYLEQPDLIGISTYIWNREIVVKLLPLIHKLLPNTEVVLGGPEPTYNSRPFMGEDIIYGDGEQKWHQFVVSNMDVLDESRSICPSAVWEFPYDKTDLPSLKNKIIYYESQRGCPYHCSYCLSALTNGVRYLPMHDVYRDLKWFSDANIKQVKFVDRTFNSNPARAVAIVHHLNEMDYEGINFHFELKGELITDELLAELNRAKDGYIKVEIGVQSTSLATLAAINRVVDLPKVYNNIKLLLHNNNVHVHLDLIAGLPYEDYNTFKRSFNDLIKLYPHELQLGFLKLLPATPILSRVKDMQYIALSQPPYEVLANAFISYDEMIKLKNVAETVEEYYNSGHYVYTMKYAIGLFDDPYELFYDLSVGVGDLGRRLSRIIPDKSLVFGELIIHDGYLLNRKYKSKFTDDKVNHDLTLSFLKSHELVEKYLSKYQYLDGRKLYKDILVVKYNEICSYMLYVYDNPVNVWGHHYNVIIDDADLSLFVK